jgi:hypothetical protein
VGHEPEVRLDVLRPWEKGRRREAAQATADENNPRGIYFVGGLTRCRRLLVFGVAHRGACSAGNGVSGSEVPRLGGSKLQRGVTRRATTGGAGQLGSAARTRRRIKASKQTKLAEKSGSVA